MKAFDVYQFILCFIVFTLLTIIFSVGLSYLIRQGLKIIRAGLNDDKIKKEYEKSLSKKSSAVGKAFDKFVLIVCCVILFLAFAMSLSASKSCNGDKIKGSIPAINVVQSGSMSKISPNHKYLKQGEYTDQLQMFDVILVKELPKEEDLKIGDIVVYESEGYFIIHRIVAIEEPNAKHPNERHFLLHGDANDVADRFPVTYEQMKGIYAGTRIPFIGSFIMFMQSPAGWLCVLLVVFAIIATPIAEKKIASEKDKRIQFMLTEEKAKKLAEEKAKAEKLKQENAKPKAPAKPAPVNCVQLPPQGLQIVYQQISDASGTIYKPVNVVKFDPKDILNSINNGGGKQ